MTKTKTRSTPPTPITATQRPHQQPRPHQHPRTPQQRRQYASKVAKATFRDARYRSAAGEFMTALWGSSHRRQLMSAAMTAIWDDFKAEADYEALRTRLSEAAKLAYNDAVSRQ